jgi:hypothetical protein
MNKLQCLDSLLIIFVANPFVAQLPAELNCRETGVFSQNYPRSLSDRNVDGSVDQNGKILFAFK